MTIVLTTRGGEEIRIANVLGYSLNEGNAIVQATFGAVTNTHRYWGIKSIRQAR